MQKVYYSSVTATNRRVSKVNGRYMATSRIEPDITVQLGGDFILKGTDMPKSISKTERVYYMRSSVCFRRRSKATVWSV